MKLKIFTLLFLMMLFGLVRNADVSTINKSCKEIKSADGFSYRHECQGATTIFVSRNKKNIARYMSRKKEYLDPMMKLDNTSFFTKECTDLQIHCIFSNGQHVTGEKWLTFNISGNLTPVVKDLQETKKTPPRDPNIGESVAGIVLLSVIVWLCWSLGIKKTLLSLFHKIFPQRNQEATAQAKTDSDLNGNHSVFQMDEIQPEIGQPATDENERNSRLESVQAQSVDCQADKDTHQALSLNNIYSTGTQPSKDGGADVPDRACNPRPMHRDLRDDPGGVTDRKVEDIVAIRDMQNGRPLVDRGRGKNENESAPLLPIQGGSIQRSNMTGEDAALVDKSCYDPDQLSKCSPASDDDVKSGSMRKCGDHKH